MNKIHDERSPTVAIPLIDRDNKHANHDIEDEESKIGEISRKDQLGQIPVPWKNEKDLFNPSFMKDVKGNKIVKYESKDLKVWGALLSFSHTIISDRDTWGHIFMLAIVSFISMVVVVVTGHNKSIFDANAVSSKIQVLISFVFAGYIGIIVNRWDRVRNGTLGSVWGALENLNMFAYHIIDDNDLASHEEKEQLKDCLLRLTRLVFQLVFLAVQGESNLKPLIEMKLLTEKEMLWLDEAVLGTRPLIVVDWMYSYFFTILKKKNYHISDPMEQHLLNEIKGLRGGVGATLGCIGSQLPYPYVHGVYWTIEVLLMSMGIEQGVWLGTDIWMKSNGEGKWKDPRPGHQWPEDPDVWYGNAFLQIVASNIIFALFCEGMLKVCDKLSNPMSRDETSFSEYVFDAFLHNNCRALRVGATAFREVLGNDLEDLIQRRHIQKDDLLD